MAEPITIQQLIEASMDSDSLEKAVNGDESTVVTSRLGRTYPSLSNALNQIDGQISDANDMLVESVTTLFENGGLPATPFKTKALMTASTLVDGNYAMVTDDTVNNGLYVKTAGAWVKSNYDSLTQAVAEAKTYTDNSKVVSAFKYQEDGNLSHSKLPITGGKAVGYDGAVVINAGHAAKVVDVKAGDLLYLTNSTNTNNGGSGSIYAFYADSPFTSTQSKITATQKNTKISDINYMQVAVPMGATKLVVNTKYSGTDIAWAIHKNEPLNDYSDGTFTLTDYDGRKLALALSEQASSDLKLGDSYGDYYSAANTLQDKYLNSAGTLANGAVGNDWKALRVNATAGDVFYLKLPADRAYPFKIIYSKSKANTSAIGDYIQDAVLEATQQDGVYELTVPSGLGVNAIFMNVRVVGAGYSFDFTTTLSVQKGSFLEQSIGDTGRKLSSIGGLGLVDSVARQAIVEKSESTKTLTRLTNEKVFALGDSITQGTRGGYVKYLNDAFGTTVNNTASSGAKVSRVVDIITAGEGLAKRDTPTVSTVWDTQDFADLKCAYIMIGTNHAALVEPIDLTTLPTDTVYDNPTTNDYWDKFPDTFVGNLSLVVEFLKWKAPTAEIYVVAPPHINSGGGTTIATAPTLHASQKAVAERYAVPFINGTFDSGIPWKLMKGTLDTSGGYSYDGIHLNERGNEVFGKFLANKILSFG